MSYPGAVSGDQGKVKTVMNKLANRSRRQSEEPLGLSNSRSVLKVTDISTVCVCVKCLFFNRGVKRIGRSDKGWTKNRKESDSQGVVPVSKIFYIV